MDAAERFARDVVAGKVPLAESARLACERHLADLRRRDWRWRWDCATADRIMDFCRDLTLSGGQWEGRPWEPLPWQAFLLRSVFGWVDSVGVRRFRKVYVETPKGSGKVMLSAAAALYLLHLDGEKRPEVYLLAETGDQAQIIFDCARQVMDRSEDLSSLGYIYGGDVVPNRIMAHDGGFIRRVDRAQGGKGRSGFVPSGIFVDELHEVRDTGLIQLYEAGTKSRVRPLTFITTNTGAGAAQATPCWIEHAYALRVVRGGVEDDRYLSFVVELDRDLDKTIFQREDPLARVQRVLARDAWVRVLARPGEGGGGVSLAALGGAPACVRAMGGCGGSVAGRGRLEGVPHGAGGHASRGRPDGGRPRSLGSART